MVNATSNACVLRASEVEALRSSPTLVLSAAVSVLARQHGLQHRSQVMNHGRLRGMRAGAQREAAGAGAAGGLSKLTLGGREISASFCTVKLALGP